MPCPVYHKTILMEFLLLRICVICLTYDVGVKRYFDPSDTELLRALHSSNSKNIRNPLIFEKNLKKLALTS